MKKSSSVRTKGQVKFEVHQTLSYFERVRPVVYKLELGPELDWIHDVFHILMLRRY